MATDKEIWFKKFEQLGLDHVRHIAQSAPTPGASVNAKSEHRHAMEWVAQFDKEERERNEASQAESLAAAKEAASAASRAADAAETANDRATTANTIAALALIAAVIAIAISFIGLFPG